ncbi:MAG TPA: nitroreductase family deazaflavin-dependent oxidoreductase [Gaiellaceae bacterium]|nr:nitroreductase family deazaflavin-dependent oxidoreductase [Gaiellaceae bacterium]
MSEQEDWNGKVIEEFRANDGVVGGRFAAMPLVLVHHRGAKSGVERINPLAYQQLDGGAVAVFASKGGAPTHPDWYYNLVANPETTIEIGTEARRVVARVATGEERERIWEAQKAALPNFAEYEQTAEGRTIPVVVLDPA